MLKRFQETKNYLSLPEHLRTNGFWIGDAKGDDVTLKLLSWFIHNPNNKKKKKMILWATEEILRRPRPLEPLERARIR